METKTRTKVSLHIMFTLLTIGPPIGLNWENDPGLALIGGIITALLVNLVLVCLWQLSPRPR